MIKQAYFRGLTKVAGGYSWYKPNTWHARRNPLSGIINPAVDVVHSITPGGRAQRKLLQGRQLTPAQDKAMQGAGSWRDAFRNGFQAWQLAMHNSLTGNVVPGTKLK